MRPVQSQYHLIFPQWNRIIDGRLDFFRDENVIVLNHFDLCCCLDTDGLRQFEVIKLLIKLFTKGSKIISSLCIQCLTGNSRFFLHCRQCFSTFLFQPFSACHDVHRQFFIILQICLIHFIKHHDIGEQLVLMPFERLRNSVNIFFNTAITFLHPGDFIPRLLKKSKKTAFCLFCCRKLFQLFHKICKHLIRSIQSLATRLFQRTVRKRRHFFLAGSAIL